MSIVIVSCYYVFVVIRSRISWGDCETYGGDVPINPFKNTLGKNIFKSLQENNNSYIIIVLLACIDVIELKIENACIR